MAAVDIPVHQARGALPHAAQRVLEVLGQAAQKVHGPVVAAAPLRRGPAQPRDAVDPVPGRACRDGRPVQGPRDRAERPGRHRELDAGEFGPQGVHRLSRHGGEGQVRPGPSAGRLREEGPLGQHARRRHARRPPQHREDVPLGREVPAPVRGVELPQAARVSGEDGVAAARRDGDRTGERQTVPAGGRLHIWPPDPEVAAPRSVGAVAFRGTSEIREGWLRHAPSFATGAPAPLPGAGRRGRRASRPGAEAARLARNGTATAAWRVAATPRALPPPATNGRAATAGAASRGRCPPWAGYPSGARPGRGSADRAGAAGRTAARRRARRRRRR